MNKPYYKPRIQIINFESSDFITEGTNNENIDITREE
jgi:hypothetical protein